MRIAVYCGANVGTRPAYEETAKKLGQWMAKNGHILVFQCYFRSRRPGDWDYSPVLGGA